MTITEVSDSAHAPSFLSTQSPFFSLGTDPSNCWLHFTVKNNFPTPKTMLLRLNRKNFDQFSLWQKNGEVINHKFKPVGAKFVTDPVFWLTDGYYYVITFPPGKTTDLYCMTYNRVGSMHLGLSLHTPENFAIASRSNVLVFGLFLGIAVVSLLFSAFLLVQYKDKIYLFYLIYVINILMREAHEYSADFGLMPFLQRHAISALIAVTFGNFYRHFLKLWEISPRIDIAVKWYIRMILVGAVAIYFFTKYENTTALVWIFRVINVTNLFFTLLALLVSFYYFKTSVRARITAIAYLPLAAGFASIILRNMNLIGNYPIIQHAIMWGFILEVLVFTIGFSVWYRTIESDRRVLQLEIELQKQEKKLAIQAAEQRVKDSIARDLHDDVAASMSGIRILSQVASSQFADKVPGAIPILAQINKSAQSAVESISDMIWAVKPNADYLNDIADRMREFASNVLEAKGISYKINIPRSLPVMELNLESKRNIYLIFKESINNALKYSKCNYIEISLQLQKGVLTMSISDNGEGFDSATVKMGNGLQNIQKRANDIGGTLEIKAKPKQGVTIELTIHLNGQVK